jgi:hypothetical protein
MRQKMIGHKHKLGFKFPTTAGFRTFRINRSSPQKSYSNEICICRNIAAVLHSAKTINANLVMAIFTAKLSTDNDNPRYNRYAKLHVFTVHFLTTASSAVCFTKQTVLMPCSRHPAELARSVNIAACMA